MSIPADRVAVPDRVVELAAGAHLEPVWVNDAGGLTFRTDDGRHIKHGPVNAETSMIEEAERLSWARAWISVPQVLEAGSASGWEWLVTASPLADIAVAAMSTEWNYGRGWQDALVTAYGVEPDRERLAYYQALWDAT